MAYSYTQEDNTVAICNLLSSVPSGAAYIEVTTFPEDRAFRGAWRLLNGELVTDLPEAKLIAHEKRRAKRDIDFKPFDDIIARQVPGVDTVEAENIRADIRSADAALQLSLEDAVDEVVLRELLLPII